MVWSDPLTHHGAAVIPGFIGQDYGTTILLAAVSGMLLLIGGSAFAFVPGLAVSWAGRLSDQSGSAKNAFSLGSTLITRWRRLSIRPGHDSLGL
jgi:hypothetical protein